MGGCHIHSEALKKSNSKLVHLNRTFHKGLAKFPAQHSSEGDFIHFPLSKSQHDSSIFNPFVLISAYIRKRGGCEYDPKESGDKRNQIVWC